MTTDAAAAMAQDELGHARSTYPVLKVLGADVEEDSFGGDRRLATTSCPTGRRSSPPTSWSTVCW